MINKIYFIKELLKQMVLEQNKLKGKKKFYEKAIARSKKGHFSLKVLGLEEKHSLSKTVKEINNKAKEINYLHFLMEKLKKSNIKFNIKDNDIEKFDKKYLSILENILEETETGDLVNNKFKINIKNEITNL